MCSRHLPAQLGEPLESAPVIVTPLLSGLLGVAVGAGVYLSPAPLYHAAPIRWTMAVQQLGGTVVVMEQFDAERALQYIER